MPELPKTIGGMPTWGVVLALGGAAIAGWFIFFRKREPAQPSNLVSFQGTGTNPADYSGSIGTLENQLLANQAQQTALLGNTGQYSLASLQAQLAMAQTPEQAAYIEHLIGQVAGGFSPSSGGLIEATGPGAVPWAAWGYRTPWAPRGTGSQLNSLSGQ